MKNHGEAAQEVTENRSYENPNETHESHGVAISVLSHGWLGTCVRDYHVLPSHVSV